MSLATEDRHDTQVAGSDSVKKQDTERSRYGVMIVRLTDVAWLAQAVLRCRNVHFFQPLIEWRRERRRR